MADAIVIGSGFGGTAAALRLSQAGMEVLVLERGQRIHDQSQSPYSEKWLWDGNTPNPTQGWIEFRRFGNVSVLAGSGVGGGSLAYANVYAIPSPYAFDSGWPAEITFEELLPYYESAGKFMGVQKVPDGQDWSRTRLLERAAHEVGEGWRFSKLDLTITFDEQLTDAIFREPGGADEQNAPFLPGLMERERLRGVCAHRGDCSIGCPFAAKTTLSQTLQDRPGIKVRTGMAVRDIRPLGNGYQVTCQSLITGELEYKSASLVLLAAGSLGSTELLLRCRANGSLPNLSANLGRQWSSNGFLFFPCFSKKRRIYPNVGPHTTCILDFQDGSRGGHAFSIEDGGFPRLLAHHLLEWMAHPNAEDEWTRMALQAARLVSEKSSYEPNAQGEALIDNMLPLIVQGVDPSDGVISLRNDKLSLDWDLKGSHQMLKAVLPVIQQICETIAGDFLVPFAASPPQHIVTPHPLGGCPIGDSPANGVADHAGRIFGYDGLYIVDSASIPRGLGCPPSRTISALGERVAHIITSGGPTQRLGAPAIYDGEAPAPTERALSLDIQGVGPVGVVAHDDATEIRGSLGGASESTVDGPPPPERRINFWISEREEEPNELLEIGGTYTGNFRVGVPVDANLFTGREALIPSSDVPASGLLTHWVVIAKNIELGAVDPIAPVSLNRSVDGAPFDCAQFDLRVPKTTDSETIRFSVLPLAVPAVLTALIYVNNKIYRELKVELHLKESNTTAAPEPQLCAAITDDLPHAALRNINVRTTHEWTTPPGEITLTVFAPGQAILHGKAGARVFSGDIVSLGTREQELKHPLELLQKCAETFRAKYSYYLNDIDPQDLLNQLQGYPPQDDWTNLRYLADPKHETQWQTVAASTELRKLRFYGQRLYNALFSAGSPLRDILDHLEAGQRININWRTDSGANWVPHIPWELLYCGDVASGVHVEATRFWGLRFRIGYMAYRPGDALMALGAPTDACCAALLFYGDSANDPTTAEAKWQRAIWSSWRNQWIVPMLGATGTTPKEEILGALTTPARPPAVLYLFCHYSLSASNVPVLRFGLDSGNPDDTLDETEIGTAEFAAHPLVFANACITGATGVYAANELEKSFFDRGCRAFIGTEAKVPVQMASRFAAAFFAFFFRLVDSEPMAGGEAMTQARLLLWIKYKNIGGLLYSYVNQYDLYMASADELAQLQRR